MLPNFESVSIHLDCLVAGSIWLREGQSNAVARLGLMDLIVVEFLYLDGLS